MLKYTLEFQEGHTFRSNTDPIFFEVGDDETALKRMRGILRLDGTKELEPMTEKEFGDRGGKSLTKGSGIQVFPSLPKEITITIQAPSWSNKTRDDWLKFKEWIESVGGQWTDGMNMHNISFTSVQNEK